LLATMLDNSEAPEGSAARFVATEEGAGLTLDTPNEGDTVIESGDRAVLLLDEPMAEQMDNMKLTVEQTEQGAALAVSPQQAE